MLSFQKVIFSLLVVLTFGCAARKPAVREPSIVQESTRPAEGSEYRYAAVSGDTTLLITLNLKPSLGGGKYYHFRLVSAPGDTATYHDAHADGYGPGDWVEFNMPGRRYLVDGHEKLKRGAISYQALQPPSGYVFWPQQEDQCFRTADLLARARLIAATCKRLAAGEKVILPR